ncbi:MAG: potassium/proton antiporter [Cyclobacteriaceae bacterium]|nr:potassium/proton antiporter [Cyclobacteriaceae bacterium]
MDISIENILLIGSLLLFVSIIAGKASYKFGIPTLILFLGIGMLAGSEGLIGIEFNDPKLAQFIGIVSLNFILFSGGLDTDWSTIKPIFWRGFSLSTLGVFITAISLGIFVWMVTDFSLYEGFLLGAIVSSTDAAAVFSILRSRSMALKDNLRPTLELESGSNDPMAYVLTIAFLGLVIQPDKSLFSVFPLFLQQMVLGGIAGISFGYASKFVINQIRLDFEGLYPVLVIALMFITFSATDFIGGNGFLSVYLCALYLGNQDLIHKKSIMRIFDGLAWLMQIVLFLTLGLLVFPSHVYPIAGIGLLISIFLIFVARPLSTFIGLSVFKLHIRSKLLLSWVGLKGAVPIVFATYPLLAGIEKAEMIFNIVFFVSVTSLLIQGTSLSLVARWLKVSLPESLTVKSVVEEFMSEEAKAAMREIVLPSNSEIDGFKIVDLHFPKDAIIALLKRDSSFITPNGTTEVHSGDTLIVLANGPLGFQEVYKCLKIKGQEGDNAI